MNSGEAYPPTELWDSLKQSHITGLSYDRKEYGSSSYREPYQEPPRRRHINQQYQPRSNRMDKSSPPVNNRSSEGNSLEKSNRSFLDTWTRFFLFSFNIFEQTKKVSLSPVLSFFFYL